MIKNSLVFSLLVATIVIVPLAVVAHEDALDSGHHEEEAVSAPYGEAGSAVSFQQSTLGTLLENRLIIIAVSVVIIVLLLWSVHKFVQVKETPKPPTQRAT